MPLHLQALILFPMRNFDKISTLPERLKGIRQKSGLNMTQLARKSGVHKGTISMIEKGNRVPGAAIVISLSMALNITSDELLGINVR